MHKYMPLPYSYSQSNTLVMADRTGWISFKHTSRWKIFWHFNNTILVLMSLYI